MPIFVGEVRCAITGLGSSWKLSGGSQLSSAPTKVSKNLHVRLAINRAKRRSSPVNSLRAGGVWRLTQLATKGETAQPIRYGAATDIAEGRNKRTSAAQTKVSSSAGSMNQRNDDRSWRAVRSAWAAVTHSNNFRREIAFR